MHARHARRHAGTQARRHAGTQARVFGTRNRSPRSDPFPTHSKHLKQSGELTPTEISPERSCRPGGTRRLPQLGAVREDQQDRAREPGRAQPRGKIANATRSAASPAVRFDHGDGNGDFDSDCGDNGNGSEDGDDYGNERDRKMRIAITIVASRVHDHRQPV